MRNTRHQEIYDKANYTPELSSLAANKESVLLAILNLGMDRHTHYDWIEFDKSVRPGNWTPEVQARIIAVCRLAIRTVETLRSLPAIRDLNEAIRRDEFLNPLNDAFAHFSIRTDFSTDRHTGQGLLVQEGLIAGVENVIEGSAMLGLRNLVKRGEIGKLRECRIPSCGAWFIAKRQDQKWCSGACRQAMYQSTETFKEQRRANYQAKKRLPASKRKKVKTNAKGRK